VNEYDNNDGGRLLAVVVRCGAVRSVVSFTCAVIAKSASFAFGRGLFSPFTRAHTTTNRHVFSSRKPDDGQLTTFKID
jgi:hypothetical protein